jgi:hypothetical protein
MIDQEELDKAVKEAVLKERKACALLAFTAGLGEPKTIPPYSVREVIAHAILSRGEHDRI